MSSLRLSNVCKGFGSGSSHTAVLHGIDLEVKSGEFVAVVGYSGTGKSTLISLLAGLQSADSGDVLQDDQPIKGPSLDRGLMFQNYSLLPWLTVLENVLFGITQRFPKEAFDQQVERALSILSRVKLSQAISKRPSELSGGMRQRVSLARTLATEPKALLLDEPLSALDALTRYNLQNEILELMESTRSSVCMITNDIDEAILLADRVYLLLPCPSGAATLSQSIEIPLARPRQRGTLIQCLDYKRLRRSITEQLMSAKQKAA